MRYTCTVEAAIELEKDVAIAFSDILEVSLHCSQCKGSPRTIVIYLDEKKSFCTPTKHLFPGYIVKMDVSPSGPGDRLNSLALATVWYDIEYDVESCVDKKYPSREISAISRWARVSFKLTCPCGLRKKASTRNNIVRDLCHEQKENPRFLNVRRKV